MSNCVPCLSLDCEFPSDLELYSLQGLQFFLGGKLFFVYDCPPDYNCETAGIPWDMRIPCCGRIIVGNVPGGASLDDIQVIWQAMVAECNSLHCANPGLTAGYTLQWRCCNTWIYGNVPAGATFAQTQNVIQQMQQRYAQLSATCNQVLLGTTTPPSHMNWGPINPDVLCLPPTSPTPSPSSCSFAIQSVLVPDDIQVAGGSLPPGMALVRTAARGAAIQGMPTTAGSYTFTVQAFYSIPTQNDTHDYTIGIMGLTSDTLPNGDEGSPYSQSLTATGGTAPYTYSLAPYSSLTEGLTLDLDGTVHGEPTVSESRHFDVIITDSMAHVCVQSVTLTIGVCDWVMTPNPLAAADACKPYTAQLATTGGTAPYTYSVDPDLIPDWLSVSSTGAITGTPANSDAGINFSFDVNISDADGGFCTGSTSVFVNAFPDSCFTNGDPPPADIVGGNPYSFQFTPSQQPLPTDNYHFSITAGSLPPGLSLDVNTGIVSGQATTAGTYPFTLSLTGVCGPCSEDFFILAECYVGTSDSPPGDSTISIPAGAGPETVTNGPFYVTQRTGADKTLDINTVGHVRGKLYLGNGTGLGWYVDVYDVTTSSDVGHVGGNALSSGGASCPASPFDSPQSGNFTAHSCHQYRLTPTAIAGNDCAQSADFSFAWA